SGSPGRTERPPRVSSASFTRSSPDLPASPAEWLLGIPVGCRVTRRRWPCIRFLFVESELGHRLSSDSASRRTPLPSLAVRAITARRGLAPPEAEHTWHTSGRRGNYFPRPPTPPDVLCVSGGFCSC